MKKIYRTKKNNKNLKKYTKKINRKHKNIKKNKSVRFFNNQIFENKNIKNIPFVIIKGLKIKKGGDIIPYNFSCDKSNPNCKTWLSLPIDTGTTVTSMAKMGYDTTASGVSGVANTLYNTAAYGVSSLANTTSNLFTSANIDNDVMNEIKKELEEKCDEENTFCHLEKIPQLANKKCKNKYPNEKQINNYDNCYLNNGAKLMCYYENDPTNYNRNKAKLFCKNEYLSNLEYYKQNKVSKLPEEATFMIKKEGQKRKTGEGNTDMGCVNNMEFFYNNENARRIKQNR